MKGTQVKSILCDAQAPLDTDTIDAMFQLYKHIGEHSLNRQVSDIQRSQLTVFMEHRIHLRPIYLYHYVMAKETINKLIDELGEQQAYESLCSESEYNCAAAPAPISVVQQYVSNEFMAFKMAQAGSRRF
ncbi:hypothetical protein [Candidatus Albibeggiatoa sp. nov. BB20]|uniref:hypothetical protein n=1 Tax=Candidatus Albibeggiatoa sp. nov. BB20 TaxID=3162723 RepID=UPI00336592AF